MKRKVFSAIFVLLISTCLVNAQELTLGDASWNKTEALPFGIEITFASNTLSIKSGDAVKTVSVTDDLSYIRYGKDNDLRLSVYLQKDMDYVFLTIGQYKYAIEGLQNTKIYLMKNPTGYITKGGEETFIFSLDDILLVAANPKMVLRTVN